jgi:hypothetical protein
MKVKTSEAKDQVLDYLVATCLGYTGLHKIEGRMPHEPQLGIWPPRKEYGVMDLSELSFSTDWSQGGPIIEREKISVWYRVGVRMFANIDGKYEQSIAHDHPGNTQLIVAMRCYVASKLGDEVEVPDDLN